MFLLHRGGLRDFLVGSYALSCSLLPLSLLLNSLRINLMLILMLRARHTDPKRLIWVRNLKSRDRPRVKQSTIERLSLSNGILQSCTGWQCAERSAALTEALASSQRKTSSKNILSESVAGTPGNHGLAQSDSIKIMAPTKASSAARALIQRGSRR